MTAEVPRPEGPTQHAPSPRTYVAVWAALLFFLALTIAVAKVHIASYGVVINLLIATTKAALVLLFFMHLRWESRFLKIMLGTALGALTLIIILTFSDVWFRR